MLPWEGKYMGGPTLYVMLISKTDEGVVKDKVLPEPKNEPYNPDLRPSMLSTKPSLPSRWDRAYHKYRSVEKH